MSRSKIALDFPDSSVSKESACNAGDLGSIPGLGRSPGEGTGYPLQHSGLVRTGHGTTGWFQIGKGVCQGCILSLCLFNLYAEYIIQNARLDEAKPDSRLPGEISTSSYRHMAPP